MRDIGIGLIGTGFMGHAHAQAFHHAASSFSLPVRPRLVALADADPERAARCADAWGFTRSCDWERLIADPQVELVAITTPNLLHAPMALAALAAGKAVYCEKPLAVSLEEATRMRDAARQAGVVNRVGYNYLQNPMLKQARELIQSGELGEIVCAQDPIHVEQDDETGTLLGHAEDEVGADRGAEARRRLDAVGGDLQHLADRVHHDAEYLGAAVDLDLQHHDAAAAGGLGHLVAKAHAKVHDRHGGAAQVDDAADGRRQHGYRGHRAVLDDLPHATGVHAVEITGELKGQKLAR